MVAWDHVTRADVMRAIQEYDRLGPEEFFAEHGFAPAAPVVSERSRLPAQRPGLPGRSAHRCGATGRRGRMRGGPEHREPPGQTAAGSPSRSAYSPPANARSSAWWPRDARTRPLASSFPERTDGRGQRPPHLGQARGWPTPRRTTGACSPCWLSCAP